MSLYRKLRDAENLTPREADLRQFVLDHPEQIAGLTARQLARITFTSAATVTRFCKKLGCGSYQEFRIRFGTETAAEEDDTAKTTLGPGENLMALIEKVLSMEEEARKAVQSSVSLPQLTRIAELLNTHQYIDLYALDSGLSLTSYAATLFAHAGKTAVAYPAGNQPLIHTLDEQPDHLAIFVSSMGEAPYLIRLAQLLRRRKVKRIILTGFPDPPLARFADEHISALPVKVPPEMWRAHFSTSVKYIFDLMFAVMFSYAHEHCSRLFDEHELLLMDKSIWKC